MIPKNTILESNLFRLRIPDESDYDFIFSASRFPGFNDGMQWEPPSSKDELIEPLKRGIKSWEEGKGYSFTIEYKKEKKERVGRISIRKTKEENIWNLGFWVHPQFQNQGVMTEAIGEMLEFGFNTLNASAITASCATWNKASEKVLIKNAFKFNQHIEKGLLKKGHWVAENEFKLTRNLHDGMSRE